MDNFAKKSNQTFQQILLIITIFSSLLAFLIFKILKNAYLYASVLVHKLVADCGCTQMTQLITMHPYVFSALFTLTALIIASFIFSAYKLIKLIISTRKFSSLYTKYTRTKHSLKLKKIIADLKLDQSKIIEIRESKPTVFCFGILIPKICISTGLIKMLDRDELEAVLLHENSHLIAHEPTKLFIVKFFYSIFFFLPGLKTSINKYTTYSELAADELATNNFTDRPKLARAIMKITDREDTLLLRDGLALSFFTSTINERVNKLSDNSYIPKFKMWGKGFLLSLFSVGLASMLLIVLLSDSAEAFNMHNASQCELNSVSNIQHQNQSCSVK